MRPSLPRSWSRHIVGITCGFAVLLTAGLASCSSSPTTQPVAKATPSSAKPTATATWPDGTWTPYPYNPTETPSLWNVTPYLPAPASTAGWQTYTDRTYHFKTVIPPGWRIGTAVEPDALNGGDCEYDVAYFPPGDTRPMEPRVWIGMQEYMYIVVNLQCPEYDLSQRSPDDVYTSSRGSVTISGVKTTLYGQDTNLDVDRAAAVRFGGHLYTFALTVTAESRHWTVPPSDVRLYLGVLHSFVYL